MTASMIAKLIAALGPSALGLIQELIAVWEKPSLTVDEVMGICDRASKSYDAYIAEAKATIKPS
jgi:hypothetical protein